MSMLFAATYPERTIALVLYGTCRGWAEEYPWALRAEGLEARLAAMRNAWGTGSSIKMYAPNLARGNRTRSNGIDRRSERRIRDGRKSRRGASRRRAGVDHGARPIGRAQAAERRHRRERDGVRGDRASRHRDDLSSSPR